MKERTWLEGSRRLVAVGVLLVIGCTRGGLDMDVERLREFGAAYTAAWNSTDPASVAGFYNENGSLKVNDGEPAVGREAIGYGRHPAWIPVRGRVPVGITKNFVAREGSAV